VTVTVRILIVEDEAVLRKNLARLFLREGYEVTTASNRAEALGELSRARFGALLLDVKLPDGDGLELLAALGPSQRPPRTFVMTASSTPETETRAKDLHVQRLLRKPLDLTRLLGIVGKALCSAEASP